MKSTINWGIIGLGRIANKFANDLTLTNNATLYGVASRNIENAKEFAQKYNALNYYDSYVKLTKDPNIDVVYIATPHPFHFENTMLCLKNGKSVLCEKPMGMHAKEVELMQKEALSRKLFLMEGLWTRFIPATEKLLELIEEKTIGDIITIHADFGFKAPVELDGRLYNKKLGGGTLLDIGIYPIYVSLLLLGIPTAIKAMARMTITNVDKYCSILFSFKNDAKAILESTIEADTPTEAIIYGTKGVLKLHRRFHQSEKISLYQNGELKETFDIKFKGNGYVHEIEEVANCILNNQLESKKLPHKASLQLIKTLDRVRDQIDLKY